MPPRKHCVIKNSRIVIQENKRGEINTSESTKEVESVFVYENSYIIGFLLSQEWVNHVVSRLQHILLFMYFIVSYGFEHHAGTVVS